MTCCVSQEGETSEELMIVINEPKCGYVWGDGMNMVIAGFKQLNGNVNIYVLVIIWIGYEYLYNVKVIIWTPMGVLKCNVWMGCLIMNWWMNYAL